MHDKDYCALKRIFKENAVLAQCEIILYMNLTLGQHARAEQTQGANAPEQQPTFFFLFFFILIPGEKTKVNLLFCYWLKKRDGQINVKLKKGRQLL